MSKKRFLTALAFVLLAFAYNNAVAQYYDPSKVTNNNTNGPKEDISLLDKMYFGGNFSLSFGTYTYVSISPLVGYRINSRLSAGMMLSYVYYKYKYSPYSANIYGFTPFTRFYVTEEIYLYGELGLLNSNRIVYDGTTERVWTAFPALGGGYTIRFGERGGFTVSALYNFNYNSPASLYGPLIIRTGFFF